MLFRIPIVRLMLAASVLASIGCQKEQSNDQPISPSRQASALIGASLTSIDKLDASGIKNENQEKPLSASSGLIEIKKSALRRAFLLSPSLTIASTTPMRMDYRPKVVSFEKQGAEIGLFELNHNAVYDDLPSDHLMQTFPIEKETEESVTIRWNYGLGYVPLKGSYVASDFFEVLREEFMDMRRGREAVLPVAVSFVRSMEMVKNSLLIDQVVRVRSSSPDGAVQDVALTVHFELTPYLKNEGFERKQSALENGIGFFEILGGHRGDDMVDLYAERWDLRPEKGPVTFLITKNVPQQYRQVVAEGVLYWNRALGREAIRVQQDADLKVKPGYREVVIHWLNWENAGFAIASLQADPLSGELLRGNIYFPSDWINIGKHDARTSAKVLEQLGIAPDTFNASTVCVKPLNSGADRDGYEHLQTAGNIPQEIAEKSARDTIRLVVAHEVGHTLGLRHNFAASLETELSSADELLKAQRRYLAHADDHGAVISSSVMDYFSFLGDGLLGAAIQERALKYDQQALAWAYENAPVPENVVFCTDSGRMGKLVGCATFDYGKNPLAHDVMRGGLERDNVAGLLFSNIMSFAFPARPEEKTSLRDALARFPLLALSSESRLARVFSLIQEGATVLAVKTRYPFAMAENRADEYRRETALALKQMLEEFGGLSGALNSIYPSNANRPVRGWMKAQVDKLAEREDLMQGVTVQGIEYRLTKSEFAQVIDFLRMNADGVEEKRLTAVLNGLSMLTAAPGKKIATGLMLGVGQEAWQASLGEFADGVLNESTGVVNGTVNGVTVAVEKPAFSAVARSRAALMLSPTVYNLLGWQADVTARTKTQVVARLQKVSGETSDLSAMIDKALRRKAISPELREIAESDLGVLRTFETW